MLALCPDTSAPVLSTRITCVSKWVGCALKVKVQQGGQGSRVFCSVLIEAGTFSEPITGKILMAILGRAKTRGVVSKDTWLSLYCGEAAAREN